MLFIYTWWLHKVCRKIAWHTTTFAHLRGSPDHREWRRWSIEENTCRYFPRWHPGSQKVGIKGSMWMFGIFKLWCHLSEKLVHSSKWNTFCILHFAKENIFFVSIKPSHWTFFKCMSLWSQPDTLKTTFSVFESHQLPCSFDIALILMNVRR